MSVPSWFDASAYFQNKCNASGLSQVKLKMAFESAGYSTDAEGLYRHFVDFGNAEGVSPNGCFNADEYLRNKAADFYGTTSVTSKMAQSMSDAMREAGMSPWDHYHLFWAESYASKGVFNNPSADFDVAAYMTDKLAQVQAAEPDANWTMDSLVEAFLAAGLSPVEHYLAFGAGEGLIPEAVSAGDSGTVDNVPGNDAFGVYDADSYRQLAGTGTTVQLPNYNNTCADLNEESLVNAIGQAITKLEGGNGDDTFTLTGTPASSLTLEGGGGNDCLVLSGSLGPNPLDNVIFDGGAGTNSVQLESSEAISLSLANIKNVSEFIITERQTGKVTLDLGDGTAGMRVDASRASASLELTTSGHGDTIILSEGNGEIDTIILTPSNTGETDCITGFTAGASGDKLDVKEYFAPASSIVFKTKDTGKEFLVVSEDSVGVFYNFSGDDLEISPNSEGLTYEKGTIYITSGKSCFILFTSAIETDPSASYTVGQIIGETFSVVGTLDTVGAALLTEENFDLV